MIARYYDVWRSSPQGEVNERLAQFVSFKRAKQVARDNAHRGWVEIERTLYETHYLRHQGLMRDLVSTTIVWESGPPVITRRARFVSD